MTVHASHKIGGTYGNSCERCGCGNQTLTAEQPCQPSAEGAAFAGKPCDHKPFCGNCERALTECRDDPCSQTMPVCRTCFAHLDKPIPGRFIVFQDGRDFYVGDEDSTFYTITAPMRVRDMDCEAAANARDWFVKIWAPMNAVTPIFEGESF